MTRTEEIAIETRVLREMRNTMSDMRCGYCCCHDHDGLEDRLEARLRDLTFEKRALDRLHKDYPGAEKQRSVG